MTKKLREHPQFKSMASILVFILTILIINLNLENEDDVAFLKSILILIIFSYYFFSLWADVICTIFLYLLRKYFPNKITNLFTDTTSLLLSTPKIICILIYSIVSYEIIGNLTRWNIVSIENDLATHWADFKSSYIYKVLQDLTPQSLDVFLQTLSIHITNIDLGDTKEGILNVLLIILCLILLAASRRFSDYIENIFSHFLVSKFAGISKLSYSILHLLILVALILTIFTYQKFTRINFLLISAFPLIWMLVYTISYHIEGLPVINVKTKDIIFAVDCSESMASFDPGQKIRKNILKRIMRYIELVEKLDQCFEFERYKLKLHASDSSGAKLLWRIFRHLGYPSKKNQIDSNQLNKFMVGISCWGDYSNTTNYICNLTSNSKDLLSFMDHKFPTDESLRTNLRSALQSILGIFENGPRNRGNVSCSIILITDGIRDGNQKDFDLHTLRDSMSKYHVLVLCINTHPPQSIYKIMDSINAKLIIYGDPEDLDDIIFLNLVPNMYKNN